jgi:DMSO/TMAO reductase YedYZ molybdopterin-dependent catalytic subunit
MALFIVRHQHEPERCPAQDPYLGAKLLNYLSRANVRQQGIDIKGEAVVAGGHTLYLIVDAADAEGVRRFMQPFDMAGSVEILPASTCARVVTRGGCGGSLPPDESALPAMDPEDACQEAIEGGLVVHRAHPLNCETSIPELAGGVVMPNAHFYVRNHYNIPLIDAASWRLVVGGLVERPLSLSLKDLHNMPSQNMVVTLECAGNGRARLEPRVDGEQWQLGAVSTAEWTGVPLAEVLDRAGLQHGAVEIAFRGADSGFLDGEGERSRFERSLGVDDAHGGEALLAYAMNGEPLPVQHGFPLRLVMPTWYAVASVKWLTEVEVLDRPFMGHWQSDKYHFEWERDGRIEREPVRLQRVRALITEPLDGTNVGAGELAIRGVAWSGAAPIERVELSLGGGDWQPARLLGERSRHSWRWWELLTYVDRGATTIRARATDLAGRTQPDEPDWNRLGYGNNAIQAIRISAGG